VLRTLAFYKLEEAREMFFTKADLEKEKDELNRLISEDEDARKAHQEFQARIALPAAGIKHESMPLSV